MAKQRCVNPFFHRIQLKPSDLLTIIPGTLILVPIRLISVILLFIIASSLSKLCIMWLNKIDKTKNPDEWQKWRITFKNIIIHLFRAILFVSGFYKITIVQKGDLSKEKDAPIYIFAPHTSLFDILAGVAFGAPSSVAKADIIDIPLFGNIFLLSDPVLVERDSKNSRQDVFKKVADVIKNSKIVFFPEGTCGNHKALMQFKTGAFKFGYPVIPVALRFNQHNSPDTLSWTWDGPSVIASLWLTLARWRTDLELTKLPVYYPSDEELKNPELFAENITNIFIEELKVPKLFYSFDDARYFKYNFFRSSACVKFLKLVDKIRSLREHQMSKSFPSSFGSSPTTSSNQNGINGINGKTHSALSTKSNKDPFTVFLFHFLDEVDAKLRNIDLTTPIDQEKLIELLNIGFINGIDQSYSLKEFYTCLDSSCLETNKKTDIRAVHLKTILNLVDLRHPNLWDRLEMAYQSFLKANRRSSTKFQFEDFKALLWLSLSLTNIDEDEEITDIPIKSFDDLRNLLIDHYEFALKENARSIYEELNLMASSS